MNKSLLVLGKGDTDYTDRNRARFAAFAQQAGFDVQCADYHEVPSVPDFKNKAISVMLFFPFTFWNAHCEVPEDTQLYGASESVYLRFKQYFLEVQNHLEQRFGRTRLHYVISPEHASLDRDKSETIKRLREHGVPTSEPVPYLSLQDIVSDVSPERGVFIKCRYGAEGKGITLLQHGRWVTNYKVEEGRLTSYGVYDRWPFTDITGREDLLEQLLQHNVIAEREILPPPVFGSDKFDLRAYVINGKVPHFFVRLNKRENVVTNFSQGAHLQHHPFTGLPYRCIRLMKRVARQAAEAMELRFVGVDMMFDGDLNNPRVVEVQAFTDFPDTTKFDLVRYMVSDASGLFI